MVGGESVIDHRRLERAPVVGGPGQHVVHQAAWTVWRHRRQQRKRRQPSPRQQLHHLGVGPAVHVARQDGRDGAARRQRVVQEGGLLESMLLLLLPQVPPAQLLASVLLYRVIYEIAPLLMALVLWAGYELLADDGARTRLLRAGVPPPQTGT